MVTFSSGVQEDAPAALLSPAAASLPSALVSAGAAVVSALSLLPEPHAVMEHIMTAAMHIATAFLHFLICITLFSGRRSPLSDRFLFVFLKYIVSATDFMLYFKDVKLQKLSGAFSGFTA